jgi:precorrin-8X/cobalt-precorrin-8 methylmutase
MLKKKVDYSINSDRGYKSGSAKGRDMSTRSFNIEKQSFDIIESEIGKHDYNENQWVIVRRVIHATADFDFAKNCKIIFHPNAIESAFLAFSKQSFIVTDVEMVLHGINKKSLSTLNITGVCYINDPECIKDSKKFNKTRSELAIQKSMDKINNGIVVIGNAPTALYEVISLIKEKKLFPSLVIGIPVGFVSAVESKNELSKLDVPFITNKGRKGGSSAASSIINALLLLYIERTTKNKA